MSRESDNKFHPLLDEDEHGQRLKKSPSKLPQMTRLPYQEY